MKYILTPEEIADNKRCNDRMYSLAGMLLSGSIRDIKTTHIGKKTISTALHAAVLIMQIGEDFELPESQEQLDERSGATP